MARRKLFTSHPLIIDLAANIAILLTVLLTFGVTVNQLGLYGSQWKLVLSPDGFTGSYGISGWILSGLTGLIGKNILFYHVLNALLLYVTGLVIYRLLIESGWDREYSLAIALLYLVFPGFGQPGAAFDLTVILLSLLFGILSLLFYGEAFRKSGINNKYAFSAGIIFAILAIIITPATALFMGIAGFIFFACYSRKTLSTKYGSVLLGFSHLLLSVLVPACLLSRNLDFSRNALLGSLKNLAGTYLLCWRKIIAFPTGGLEVLLYFIVLVAVIIGLAIFFKRLEKDGNTRTISENFHIYIVVLSLLAGFVFLTELGIFSQPNGTEFPDDLNMVIAGLFVAFFIISLIRVLFQKEYQFLLLALIIGFSGGARYQVTNRFADENHRIENFLSQIQVRGDSFKDGTSLLVEQLPFELTSREAIEALLREKMGGEQTGLNSVHVIPAENPEVREFLSNVDQESIELRIDTTTMLVDKSNMVALWIPDGKCLQILEPGGVYKELPQGLALASLYSNPNNIIVKYMSDVLQLDRFRTTIYTDTCFETQLIHRFAAKSEWDNVIDTYSNLPDASRQNFDFYLIKPVLVAMMEKGNLDAALTVTQDFMNNPEQKKSICHIWSEIISLNSSNKEVVGSARQAFEKSGCQ